MAYALIAAGARVTVADPRADLGRGIAYATSCPLHLLNAPAGRMSALSGAPDHFLRWLEQRGTPAEPSAFVPRAAYGDYITAIVDDMRERAGSRFVHVRSTVTDAAEHTDSVVLTCADGSTISADAVVIAIGNPKPSIWPGISEEARTSQRFFESVWRERAMEASTADETVVLLGTGLTAVDAVLGLRYHGHRGPIVMISRRGLLPHEHRLFDRPPPAAPNAATLGELIDALRNVRALDGADWRQAIDVLRAQVNQRWEELDENDRRRFFRHVLPYWNVHRHRMAPAVAEEIATLRAAGALEMIAGRTGSIELTQNGLRVPVTLRGTDSVRVIDAQRVINCSGPENDVTKRTNPLVRSLLATGTIAPHPLRVGMQVAADGALIDASGTVSSRMFAIGPVRSRTDPRAHRAHHHPSRREARRSRALACRRRGERCRRANSPQPWESTGLVARSVFKTAEAFARGLVGSIPTLSRQFLQQPRNSLSIPNRAVYR